MDGSLTREKVSTSKWKKKTASQEKGTLEDKHAPVE